jgi:hypothetical protein
MFLLRSSILLLTGMIAMSGSVVNACHDDELLMIVDQGIIHLGTNDIPFYVDVPDVCYGTEVSFWYVPNPSSASGCDVTIDSVKFSLIDGLTWIGIQEVCEKNDPYALFTNDGGDFKTKKLDVGAYVVDYDLYTSTDCSGAIAWSGGVEQHNLFSFNVITCPNP